VRGGGKIGSGRSSGAGAPTIFDSFAGGDDDEPFDLGSSSSINVVEPASDVVGSPLTNREEVEPDGSENGFAVLE